MSYDYWIIKPRNKIREVNEIDGEDKLSNIGDYKYLREVFENVFPDISWKDHKNEFGKTTSWWSVPPSRMRIEVYFDNCDVVTQIHICTSSRMDSSVEIIAVAKELGANAIDMQTMKIVF